MDVKLQIKKAVGVTTANIIHILQINRTVCVRNVTNDACNGNGTNFSYMHSNYNVTDECDQLFQMALVQIQHFYGKS